jgi:hypothetical protein
VANLLSNILHVVTAAAQEARCDIVVDGPRWSEEWKREFYAVRIGSCAVEGAIFPEDANFWNKAGFDVRFERIDFESDRAMLAEIRSSLEKVLARQADGG